MGLATVVEHRGEGLYRVRLAYDLTTLDGELLRLQAAQAQHWALLLRALNTLDLARQASGEAREAMNAVIVQWQQALIDAMNENPPILIPPEPNDPETGDPWEDPDRAQDAPLFAAINGARVAAGVDPVTRDSDLDAAMVRYLSIVARSGRMTHNIGGNIQDRLWASGYGYDQTVGVGELLAPGALTPTSAVEMWQRLSANRAILRHADYTEVGVAYLYAPESPCSHWWGAVFATPGAGPSTETPPATDPAEKAAETTDATLQKIEIPTVDTFQPQKLSAACGAFARAKAAEQVADEAMKKLQADVLTRDGRIAQLTELQTASLAVLDVWICRYITDIPVGTKVSTAEIPGYYDRETEARITVMGQRNDPDGEITDQYLDYIEHPINLLSTGLSNGPASQLRHADVMSDSAVFVNLALEPGHFKWKPLWRYGTLISVIGNLCSVLLDAGAMARGTSDLAALPIDTTLELLNVPISYPPCHGEVFQAGDQVLVLFEGYHRDAPKVIGFRREPRPCPGRPISWGQIS